MASWPPPSHQKMQLQAGGYNLIISVSDQFTDPISVNSILVKTTVYRSELVNLHVCIESGRDFQRMLHQY